MVKLKKQRSAIYTQETKNKLNKKETLLNIKYKTLKKGSPLV